MHVSYDAESNILSLELAGGDIAYAKEMNGTIIHLTSSSVPVLIEILEAGTFLAKFGKLKKSSSAIKPIPSPTGN